MIELTIHNTKHIPTQSHANKKQYTKGMKFTSCTVHTVYVLQHSTSPTLRLAIINIFSFVCVFCIVYCLLCILVCTKAAERRRKRQIYSMHQRAKKPCEWFALFLFIKFDRVRIFGFHLFFLCL